METIDNNKFEVKPTKSKRKTITPCPNVFLNPALDLLANEDPICNSTMEVVPNKKRKHTKGCDIPTFENTALDLGISKAAVNEFLVRELDNVRKNMRTHVDSTKNVCEESDLPNNTADEVPETTTNTSINNFTEPIYANLTGSTVYEPNKSVNTSTNPFLQDNVVDLPNNDNNYVDMDSGISILEQKSFTQQENTSTTKTNIQTNVTNQVFINNSANLNLSFIDRLALDSPNLSNQSLYFDDDLNESNIMEIKTITIITKKKRVPLKAINTNPFLDPDTVDEGLNQLNDETDAASSIVYNSDVEIPSEKRVPGENFVPRRLFTSDTNSTISTVDDSVNFENHEYENIDGYRAESPIYENIGDEMVPYNKQSKVLGYDVSKLSAHDILNLNKLTKDTSTESNESKKDLKYIFKASNKLSKKVIKKIRNTFKGEKSELNATQNPYEVPRKLAKQKKPQKEAGFENPALKLDNSDEIEIEEIDDEEHQYETVKTLRNTQLNTNVTPLKERVNDISNISTSKSNTPGKKVRFDSTLNQEKVITGDSFDRGDIQSPGFDAKIDEYHDELENCINERKFLQQNM